MKTKQLLVCISLLFATQLVLAQNPEVWGITQSGGAYGQGTIFNMKSNGADFTTAYSFHGPNGWMPMGNLLRASDGNLYGACFEGGDYYSCTLYKFNPDNGDYSDVYSFDIIHGDFPTSGVVEKDGILYGNSSSGGFNGGGVIYSYDIATGVYTDMYNMTSATGSYPYNAPIVGTDGKLYGVTEYGGTNSSGVIYSYDIDNSTYTVVHAFNNYDAANGGNPYGSLIQASNGKLYGMTYEGGANSFGLIFSFDPSDNTYTDIYDFDGTNGGNSKCTLTEAGGVLYGLTTGGGTYSEGVIFRVALDGSSFTKLYDFTSSDGSAPLGNLMIEGTILCGTTSTGGSSNHGTAFNFSTESGVYTKLIDFTMSNGANPNGGFITLGSDVGTVVQSPVNGKLSVYPNPASDYAICTLPSAGNGMADITVTDVCGKQVLAQQVEITNSKLKIDVADLASGVYNLEVNVGTEKKTAKLVKE